MVDGSSRGLECSQAVAVRVLCGRFGLAPCHSDGAAARRPTCEEATDGLPALLAAIRLWYGAWAAAEAARKAVPGSVASTQHV